MACLGHLAAFRFRLESRLELFCPVLTRQGKGVRNIEVIKKKRANRLGLCSGLRAL